MLVMAKKREGDRTNVAILPEVYAKFHAYCAQRKAIKTGVVNALIEWFLALPTPMQSAILGVVDPGMEQYYIAELEKLITGLRDRQPADGGRVLPDGTFGETVEEIQKKIGKPRIRSQR